MAAINFKAFEDQHRKTALALITKVKSIYDENYTLITGLITLKVQELLDGSIRTNIALLSRSNEQTLENTVIIIVTCVGDTGRIEIRWQDGVVETVKTGSLLIDEYIQTINEMKDITNIITSLDDFPPYATGNEPPLPINGALQDEENEYVLDENYNYIELE